MTAVMDYATLRVRVCAPRAAVLYRAAGDWMPACRRAIASVSGLWGGSGHAVLPLNADNMIDPVLLGMLARYDPDVVAVRPRSFEEGGTDDLQAFDAWLDRQPMQPRDGEDEEQARRRFADEIAPQAMNEGPLDGVCQQVYSRCAPYRHLDHEEVAWLPPDGAGLDLLPPVPQQSGAIYTLDLSDVDRRLALMVESRVGVVDERRATRANLVQLAVEEEDVPALVELAITGTVRWRHWDLHTRVLQARGCAITGPPPTILDVDGYLQATPMARTRIGLEPISARGELPQAVIVVGETPADHALALLCDRLFGLAAWLPSALLGDQQLRPRVLLALQELKYRHRRPAPKKVLLVSASEPADRLDEIRCEVINSQAAVIEGTEPTAAWLRVATVAELAGIEAHSLLADPELYDQPRFLPASRDTSGGVNLLAPVGVVMPTTNLPLDELRWQVDVNLLGHTLPPRTAVSGRVVLAENDPAPRATLVRADRDGISYHCDSYGYIPAGTPRTGRLARPLLRFPTAGEVFSAVAGPNVTTKLSAAGRRSRNAMELWGGLDGCAEDLGGPVRRMLDAFTPPASTRDGKYQGGLALHGQGYLTFNDVAPALGQEVPADETTTRTALDRLLGLGVLRRGLVLRCDRCLWLTFYPIEGVGRSFECSRCGHRNRLTQERWREPVREPAWYYDLDQVVRDLLANNGDVPLLAAYYLRQHRSPVVHSPELELIYAGDEKPFAEVDICVIAHGQIIVGEAKSTAKLPNDDASKLAAAANTLDADEVLLATTQLTWPTDTVNRVARQLGNGRRIRAVATISGVGTPHPQYKQASVGNR